ncbi:MAG TPA: C40 family peptidase [Steroidobacteraceae bacterium]|nr:C40 family peptidase [Steroidobacteraceae bacterium]
MRAMRTHGATGLPGVLTMLVLAAGCAGTPARDVPTVEPLRAPGDARGPIAQLALSMVGVQYRYGGAHPREGFDCSGLVYYTYTSNGHSVPRSSRAQFGAARVIPLADAAEGDLVFFQDQENLSHVGIYLGDGRFVHAPSSGGAVRIARIGEPYYQRYFVAAGRLLP